jgi:adenosylcobinamide kinase/adenosylcobinamide-phosphate guanylyltransferase
MALTVLLGGARSGKSKLAVQVAADTKAPVVVVATGEARDDEMAERIRRHRAERPPAWRTLEEPIEVARAIDSVHEDACVLLDCLTLWVSNLLERGCSDDEIERRARAAARSAALRNGVTIAVSNEVGWGIVPAEAVSRRYRDALGKVNTIWVEAADRAALVVAGGVIALAPAAATFVRDVRD